MESALRASDDRYPREQVLDRVERIDREAVEEPQKLASRLPDAMLRHAGNEDGAPRLHRDFFPVERHDARPGEHVVDFRRRMAVQSEPVAWPQIADAAGDAVGRRAALGEERAPANAPLDGIVPAVERGIGLVLDERFDDG